KAARDTRELEIGPGVLPKTADAFRRQFANQRAVVIGDTNTMRVAGNAVAKMLGDSQPFVFEDSDLYAEHRFVERLQDFLATRDAIPVAVGSGTINDVTKLAAHRHKRPYLCVTTAASMDGYTAYGASITYKGSKQTFDCPAPRAVVADIDIIRAAPPEMTASGYADLLAKITAGADWILADALGIEPIHPQAWDTVQNGLLESLAHPLDIERLTRGLMMAGFAMQAMMSSRPASGAEHQFSHLWDMQHHTHNDKAPSHGFKVGVATLAVARLYETMLQIDRIDKSGDSSAAPTTKDIDRLFESGELRDKAIEETQAKKFSGEHLNRLQTKWPELKQKLRAQLPSVQQIQEMLQKAGAPTDPKQIGISKQRLRDSFRRAYHIRRRFTILDVAVMTGLLEPCLEKMF
ncbi:MAG TPA: sn-glycerol-1-phosphate dehydrogenase, partial [Tepidisphaeraceae bacterium]|nr:sn-glycerol-1-phosphate dehydrogenase [Tepidisphaeraceae bacterium]